MSYFYGVLQGGRGQVTRTGSSTSGLSVTAASWKGAITVTLAYDRAANRDLFVVRQRTWEGAGINAPVASGVIGEPLPSHWWQRFLPEHPKYKIALWRYEVANGDSLLGYWDWVADKMITEGEQS